MQDLWVSERLIIPSKDLRWRFSRSSGPGGQGVNTTDSRVELILDVANCSCLGPFRRARLLEHFQTRLLEGCLRVVVAEERSQWQNRQKALHRLGGAAARGFAATAAHTQSHPSWAGCGEAETCQQETTWRSQASTQQQTIAG